MVRRMYATKRRLRSRDKYVLEEKEDETMEDKNFARFHVISGENPNSPLICHKTAPQNRSGHRMFVTHDYLYLIGGYDAVNGEGVIYKDVWRMNLLTKTWVSMEIENLDEFPVSLASFAICQVAPFSNKIILFGGTDIPFGVNSSKKTYLLTMKTDGKVHSEKIEYRGVTRSVYGHAMVRDGDSLNPTFYCIGGTTGHDFYLDIFKLTTRIEKEKFKWSWKREAEWYGSGEDEPTGLYRLECIIDNDKMIMFGGGTPDYVQNFENMIVYDMKARVYTRVRSYGDPEQDSPFPSARRCHSITQFGRKVILAGGCGKDQFNDGRYNQIFGDVWVFDLDKFSWKKHPTELVIAVFFHAAAITDSGCLLIHGGVSEERSAHRTNTLQALWISPPPLLHWSSEKIMREIQNKRKLEDMKAKKNRSSDERAKMSDLVLSRCDKIFSRVVNPPA